MIRIDQVAVEYGRSSEDFRQLVILVRVLSRRKKGLSAQSEVNPAKCGTVLATVAAIQAAAGAGAEYLGEKYGDNIDPDQAAKNAVHAFQEETKLLAESSRQVAHLVARMMTHRAKFSDPVREQVERWDWLLKHGQPLTPRDRADMGPVLAALHKSQL